MTEDEEVVSEEAIRMMLSGSELGIKLSKSQNSTRKNIQKIRDKSSGKIVTNVICYKKRSIR